MVSIISHGEYLINGTAFQDRLPEGYSQAEAENGSIASQILAAHNTAPAGESLMKIKFDALASHDITYVGILLTSRAGGLKELPVPYVLTNCHNSLCAVGGTINEDDHVFGLSAAKKYGAVYVPAHQAVIHSFMREMYAGCGKMILGSDSHTRYGALGTMACGEGGPELVKQILGRTYDIKRPGIIAVNLTGKPRRGVGPHDVALALIGAVYESGFVKNKVLEFVGEGAYNLPIEFRNGIDVMTTETTCLSSIWVTDDKTKEYLAMHGRVNEYKKLEPKPVAYYDGVVNIDLSTVEPMIALPFHPSNTFSIRELNANAGDILRECERKGSEQLGLKDGMLRLTDKIDRATGRVRATQGVIAGCAGGIFDNLCAASDVLSGYDIGNDTFSMSVYPASQPCFVRLTETGVIASLMRAGVTVRSAFCGPCFGAGDVPANGGLSLRHSTRNFPNREGSKPGEGQMASVALMDARSIAATARFGGLLTGADELDVTYKDYEYKFDRSIYEKRVYNGFGKANPEEELIFGPNISDWPKMKKLSDHLLLGVCSVIDDPVTTTDELIPSGESSSYRSNPNRLSRLTLSRRDPAYVSRADRIKALDVALNGGELVNPVPREELDLVKASMEKAKCAFEKETGTLSGTMNVSSVVCAVRPGDGSAREQAASCQRVLGGGANIAREYATKRYRSNLINWGMLPLLSDEVSIGENHGNQEGLALQNGDWVLLPSVRETMEAGADRLPGLVYLCSTGAVKKVVFNLGELTNEERKILLAGWLTGYYKEC